ncbi:GntR family transcriptional regulator [uncultured Cohaesibacter sp.]|uniref:GntR family transcriptional regulator n=1 Tax=uncultured Cohaesibacter sp. TaxID=1002546 RepID=UPI00292F7C27|nr:GntR family transcriptional regulator [uncultured Cohaesibacter sp.]
MTENNLDFLGPVDFSRPIGPQILRKLRNAIIRTYLKPGRRVSEAGVAEALNVSRQPVRETFIRLSDQGMLEVRPKSGSCVPQISISKVIQIQAVREAIEADVVRNAARLLSAGQIEDLNAILKKQESEDAEESSVFMELDDQFHKALAIGAKMPHAWNVIESQKALMDRVSFLSLSELPSSALGIQHKTIVAAIANHDPDRAESEMRTHLRAVLNDLPMIVQKYGSYFIE